MDRVIRRVLGIVGVVVLVFVAGFGAEVYRDVVKPMINPSTPALIPPPTPKTIPTPIWPDATSTSAPECLKASAMIADMKGEMSCAYGEVSRIAEFTGAWQIRFDAPFFLAGGAYFYPDIKKGDCVYAEGKVLLSSENIPYINIDDDNLFYCEDWMTE